MILETSFILNLWAGEPKAVAKAQEIANRGNRVYLATPSLFELWDGVARSDRPREETEKIRRFIEGHDLLPFGEDDAREAGLLLGKLSRSGRTMNTVDAMLAGMAKARREVLLTADRGFRQLVGEVPVEVL